MLRALMLLGAALSAHCAVHGVVRDAQSGEALARVSVELADGGGKLLTGADGAFEFTAPAPGAYTLKAATVGYRLTQVRFELREGETREFEIALSPDTFRRSETVEVRADPFDLKQGGAHVGPTAFTLDGGEAKNLASVLADDPMRAIQSLPGVRANDDFEGRFSLHGAPYQRVGLFLDGVLLHQPFHTVTGEGPSGSMAVFNGDVMDSLTVQSEAYPARFGNRTAGVVDVRTREGNRAETSFRVNAGAAGAGMLAEGPLGRRKKGSWLMSVRRSYLEYLLQQSFDQPMAFGFMDAQGQLSYDLGRGHYLKARVLDGTSDFDRRRRQEALGLNASTAAGYRVTLAQTAWQYAPGAALEVRAHAAYMREGYENVNRLGRQLAHGRYGEWVGSAGATWLWSNAATLEAGAEVRRVRTQGFADWYANPSNHTRVEANRGSTLLTGGYAQQSWSAWAGRLRLSAGARWDRASEGAAAISPNASASWMPWNSGRLQLSWGQYAQFPDAAELYSICGDPRLLPARSTHAVAALEQRIGLSGRIRVQAYQRIERDLLFRPDLEARLAGGRIVPDDFKAPLANSLRGYARGIEFFAQRRTANRLTGWVSYSLGWARMRDGVSGATFFADQDQRHTVNVYLGYRIRPSVNLSTKWAYGSGFPAPGYFERRGNAYFLSSQRNGARLPAYQRTDVRINKSITFDRWKMTVYGEVVNVFNRKNYRFDSYDGYNAAGLAYVSVSSMFPVLPSAGIMLEF